MMGLPGKGARVASVHGFFPWLLPLRLGGRRGDAGEMLADAGEMHGRCRRDVGRTTLFDPGP